MMFLIRLWIRKIRWKKKQRRRKNNSFLGKTKMCKDWLSYLWITSWKISVEQAFHMQIWQCIHWTPESLINTISGLASCLIDDYSKFTGFWQLRLFVNSEGRPCWLNKSERRTMALGAPVLSYPKETVNKFWMGDE